MKTSKRTRSSLLILLIVTAITLLAFGYAEISKSTSRIQIDREQKAPASASGSPSGEKHAPVDDQSPSLAAQARVIENNKLTDSDPGQAAHWIYGLFLIIGASVTIFVCRLWFRFKKFPENSQWFASIAEQTHILVRRPNGKIIYWSKGMERLYLWKKEEVLGKLCHELLDTQYLEDPAVSTAKLIQQGEWEGELSYVRKDGIRITVSSHCQLTRDAHGQPDAIIETNHDITAQKKAEEELIARSTELEQRVEERSKEILRKEARFRVLVESSQDIISMVDKDGIVIYTNPAFEKITGIPISEVVGKPSVNIMHPDQGSESAHYRNLSLERPGIPIQRLNRFVKRGGGYVWVEGFVTNLLMDEGVQAIVSTFKDITSRIESDEKIKESEERYRALMETSLDGIVVTDVEGDHMVANPAMLKMLGYTDHEFSNLRRADIIDLTDSRIAEASAQRTRTGSFRGELNMVRKGQVVFPVEISSNLFTLSNGEQYISSSMRDISDRKQLEKFSQEEKDRLEKIASRVPGVIYQYRLRPDGSSGFPFLSEAIRKYIQASPEENREDATKIFSQIHPDDIDRVIDSIHKSATELTPWQGEFRTVLKDGSVRSMFGNSMPEKEADGSVLWHGFMTDITQTKQEREMVETQNELLTSIMNSDKEMIIFSVDRNYNYTSFNRKHFDEMRKVWNVDIRLGLNLLECMTIPELRAGARSSIERALSGQSLTEISHQPGQETDYEITWNPIFHEGDVTGVTVFIKNITERKRVDRALQESEYRYRILADNSLDVIWTMDLNWNFTYVSPSVYQLRGFTPDEVMKQSFDEVISPGSHDTIRERFVSALSMIEEGRKAETRPVEVEQPCKDGTTVWTEVVASVLYDNAGKAQGVLGVSRNIQDRKRSEETINQLSQAVEQSPVSVIITDVAGHIQYVNKKFLSDTGYKVEDVMGQHSRILKSGLTPPEVYKDLWQTISSGAVWDGEFLSQKKNGELYWEFVSISPMLNAAGQPTKFLAIKEDISERKNAELKVASSERYFRTLIENSADAIVLNDENANVLYQSPSVSKILGFSAEERVGKNSKDRVHPRHKRVVENLYTDLKANPEKPIPFEYQVQNKQGVYVWIEGVACNLLHEPNIGAIVVNYRDISERKLAEEKLRSFYSELEKMVDRRTNELAQANDDLESFTYSVSHDLRAPLRIIDGYSQALLEDYSEKLDKAGCENIDVIRKSARRMGKLIDDLLSFSKLGRTELRIEPVKMDRILNEVLRELSLGGTVLPGDIRIGKMEPALGDETLLKEIWLNLVSNAIKYSGKVDHPIIEIGSYKHGEVSGYFIRDNGIGFDMKYAEKLFVVFQRLHKATDFPGTGVGLALVKRIVERHGGTIWAESKPGLGATFWFTLRGNEVNSIDEPVEIHLEKAGSLQVRDINL